MVQQITEPTYAMMNLDKMNTMFYRHGNQALPRCPYDPSCTLSTKLSSQAGLKTSQRHVWKMIRHMQRDRVLSCICDAAIAFQFYQTKQARIPDHLRMSTHFRSRN